jgi:hypothetical protein
VQVRDPPGQGRGPVAPAEPAQRRRLERPGLLGLQRGGDAGVGSVGVDHLDHPVRQQPQLAVGQLCRAATKIASARPHRSTYVVAQPAMVDPMTAACSAQITPAAQACRVADVRGENAAFDATTAAADPRDIRHFHPSHARVLDAPSSSGSPRCSASITSV